MNTYDKLEWIHFALQEAKNGNLGELDRALELVELLREIEYMNMQKEDHKELN
jgi:hypothetical protein